jgi:hypothetical protein
MTRTRVSSKPTSPEAVLAHVEPGADIVMPNANREPVELVDTLERRTERLLARGDVLRRGQGFLVLHATTRDGGMSKIRPTLTPGSVVTTSKNTVDKIVTEFGVAELRGKTLRQRAQALIAIADPRFRDELSAAARQTALI